MDARQTFGPPGGEDIRMEPQMNTDEHRSVVPGGRPPAAGMQYLNLCSSVFICGSALLSRQAVVCRASVRRSRPARTEVRYEPEVLASASMVAAGIHSLVLRVIMDRRVT
jgi:hypothetical protein